MMIDERWYMMIEWHLDLEFIEKVPEDARPGFTFSKFEKTECPLDFHWKADLVRLGSSRSVVIYLDVL